MQYHTCAQAYLHALYHILSLGMSTSAYVFQLFDSLAFINILMP